MAPAFAPGLGTYEQIRCYSGLDIKSSPFGVKLNVLVVQDRAHVAQKILEVVRKQKAELIRGMETLCNAYITLAYMDASKHKTEKSESDLSFFCRSVYTSAGARGPKLSCID